jgi:hypothetical protein
MTAGGTSGDDESNNPYLALRAAKIARNEARLRELGLLKTLPPATAAVGAAWTAAATSTATYSLPHPAMNKAKVAAAASKRKVASTATVDRSHLRRSKRHVIVVTPVQNTDKESSSSSKSKVSAVGRRRGKGLTLQSEPDAASSHATTEIAALPPTHPSLAGLAPNAARAIQLDVAKLVEESSNGLLGRVMSKTGKAFVMEEAARLAAENYYNDKHDSSGISFNKYSGVQEWANALFLWINLGAPNCDVINTFLQEGRQVTWFGGSRMHEKTRAIQRLMHEGQQQHSSSSSSSSSSIVLWCRRYQPTTKTFTPYTCMGRLSYHSHEAGSRPLAFCWNLVDYDRLVQHDDDQVRQNFGSIICTGK